MSEETSKENDLNSTKQSHSNDEKHKRKHRWYHWASLVLLVLMSLFNIFEGLLMSGTQTQILVVNILSALRGEFDFVTMPDGLEIEGEDSLVVDTRGEYAITFSPDNAYGDLDVHIEVTSDIECGCLMGDLTVTLFPKEIGEVTIDAYLYKKPEISVSKTIKITDIPIEEITATLRGGSTITKGATSHLVVRNDGCSLDIDRFNFISTDPSIATIDEKGYIKSYEAGTVEVYAQSKEDPSICSEPVELTVVDETFYAPTSISCEPMQLYTSTFSQPTVTFNNGESCSDVEYVITYEGDDSFIRQGLYYYWSEPTEEITVKVSSVYDPSVYCETTVEFMEVKASGILVEDTVFSFDTEEGHQITASAVSAVEGYSVTYPNLAYEIIEGEDIASVNSGGYIYCNDLEGDITVRISLDQYPETYVDVEYSIYFSEKYYDQLKTAFLNKFLGHFCLFAVEGLFACLTMYFFVYEDGKKKKNNIGLISFIVGGFAVSGFSEFTQLFVDRGSSWSDVGLNFGSYLAGFAIMLIILLIIYLVKNHKEHTEKQIITKGLE